MAKHWSDIFPLWRQHAGGRDISRRTLLAVYLLVVLLSGALVSLLPSVRYDSRVLLVTSGLVLLMLPLVPVRLPGLFRMLFYAATLAALFMAVYMVAHTGGINSSAMVWLNVLAMPVLLLRGPRQTLVWLGLMELTTLGIMLATRYGLLGSHPLITPEGVPWALFNHVLALCDLMFAVLVYHSLHVLQMRELDRRNTELQATHQALIQAQAHKDEFVAAVGHELRTPMNAILGFNGVLRRELADRPEQVEVVDHIRRSTEHLLRLVNEILDFSQLQAGKVQLFPSDFDLPQALREVMSRREPAARHKGLVTHLDIAPDVPVRVRLDRQRLLQVLGLLLDNACKFTAHGEVRLNVACTEPRCLRFEVRDTGCGIAPERQAHIFRRFEHADVQTNRTYGGTGLGLTICDKLVSLQGGRIGVHSVPEQGSLFWFELPFEPAQPAEPENVPDAQAAQDMALRILVVDDNPVNLKVAQLQLLKIWPAAQVTTAGSGAEALALLASERFDVALVDMIMPVMDGMQLTRQIRAEHPAASGMPILALTANTNPVERERCLAAGMSDVLHKPMDADSLLRSVAHHLHALRVNGGAA